MNQDFWGMGLEIQAYYPGLARYLGRLVGPDLAEDLAQETLARALAGQAEFCGDASRKNWLYRIAHNLAVDQLRTRSREALPISLALPVCANDLEEQSAFSQIIDERPWNLPGEAMERQEMIECIADFVNALQPNFKALIILSELDHFEQEDIADILDISAGNVRVRLHRARVALRKALSEGCHIYQGRSGDMACDRS